MQQLELLHGRHLIHNKTTKLSQDVGGCADERLILCAPPQGLHDVACRVLLHGVVVGHQLHDAVPDVVAHKVAGFFKQAQHHVHIPLHTRSKLLCKDCDLEHQLLSHRIVCFYQVVSKLVHNHVCIGAVAHCEEQVHGPAANRHIRILQAGCNGGLVPSNGFQDLRDQGQAGHGLQSKVLGIGLLGHQELAQHSDTGVQERAVRVQVDGQRNGLKQNAVQCVRFVGVGAPGRVPSTNALDGALHDCGQQGRLRFLLRHGKELQHPHALALQPGSWDAVVQVLWGHLRGPVYRQPLQHLDEPRLGSLVASWPVARADALQQRGGGKQQPQVPLIQQGIDDDGEGVS
mmetsp:Transcript_24375/g.66601  ORF Transcript_24375/g.66601 Transcript_24375/m.66601 type:complete len:345 (-) Transcript_24375:706-1740(-)